MHSTTRSSRSRSAATRAANAPRDCASSFTSTSRTRASPSPNASCAALSMSTTPDVDPADLDGQREPGRERVHRRTVHRRGPAHDADANGGFRKLGPRVLAVRGEGVLLHGEQRRLGERRARPDEEVRLRPRGGEQHRHDVAGDDPRQPLDDTLQDPPVALGRPDVAREVRRRLERLEAPLGVGVETGPLPAKVHLLERAQHRLLEVDLLPRLDEVAVDLAAVDGVDDLAGIGVRGEEDRAEVRVEPARRLDELDARHVRHALVADEEIHPPAPEDLERARATVHGEGLVAVFRTEATAQDLEHLRLVVHEQDDVRHPRPGPLPNRKTRKAPHGSTRRVPSLLFPAVLPLAVEGCKGL